jgi:hypothetical protein
MAGLNELLSNKENTTSTMPNWFTSAQQNLVSGMPTAGPAIGDTAAQSAISTFSGQNNPFTQGQSSLNAIGAGAANPWLTDASGNITPNTSTAMGGLFGAQKDYLNSIMGDIDTAATAPSIGSGGFGSKMNLAGVAKARGTAANDLFQKQMTSALQNQQTGVSAGAALGNLGNQQIQSALNTGTYQQNAPYASALNTANILAKMNVPTSTTKQTDVALLNQLAGLGSMFSGGLNALNDQTILDKYGNKITQPGILSQLGVSGGVSGLIGKAFGSGDKPTTDALIDTSNIKPGEEGFGWQYFNNGVSISPEGNYYQGGNLIYSPPSDLTTPSDAAMAQDSNFNWSDWYTGDNGYGNSGE